MHGCAASANLDGEEGTPPESASATQWVTTPALWYAFASVEPDDRSSLSLDDSQALLGDDTGGVLSDALAAAGWSSDESAALVTLAAGHNSGAPHDATLARQLELREEIAASFQLFEEQLEAAEAVEGEVVDREQLYGYLQGAAK